MTDSSYPRVVSIGEPMPFTELRLKGPRFDGPGMPVEALSELVAYRELLIGVAKAVFLRNHPDRHRLPKGFGDRVQLRFRRVEAGSAVVVLERITADEQPAMLPVEDEFATARQLIEDAIVSAGRGEGLPRDFPVESLRYFNRFGKTLRPDEAIRLRAPHGAYGADYTHLARKRLLLSRERTYHSDRTIVGRVVEVNVETPRFNLRAAAGDVVTCYFEPELFQFVHDALRPDGAGPMIMVEGEAVLDDRDVIQRIAVTDVSYAEDAEDSLERVPDRPDLDSPGDRLRGKLAELGSLPVGWLDGEGKPPAQQVITALSEIAEDLTAAGLPRLRAFPTPEAGVQLEWSAGSVEYSIHVKADLSIYAIQVDTESGEAHEKEIERFDPAALVTILRAGVAE